MLLKRVCLFLFLYAEISFSTNAQFVKINNLTVRDGLPHNTITYIYKDSHGFVWFCTPDGLSKYDGYKFINYRPDPDNPKNTLLANIVTTIVEEKNGILWVGTDRGLDCFNPTTQVFQHIHLPVTNMKGNDEEIYTLYISKDNILWVGGSSGLSSIDLKDHKLKHYQNKKSDTNNLYHHINGITQDRKGQLWMATGKGVRCLNHGKFNTYFSIESDSSSFSVKVVFEDSKGVLWAGGERGLYYLNQKIGRFIKYKTAQNRTPNNSTVNCISEDKEGNLWIGTQSEIFLLDSTRKSVLRPDNLNPLKKGKSSGVASIYFDTTGVMWVGKGVEGVNLYESTKNKFSYYGQVFDDIYLSNHDSYSIWAISQDTDSSLLLGTQNGGLLRFDRKTNAIERFKTKYLNNEGVSMDILGSIAKDMEGRIWTGSYNYGATVIKPGKKGLQSHKLCNYQYIRPDVLQNYQGWSIRSILVNKSGFIWLGSIDGGISKINPISLKPIPIQNSSNRGLDFNHLKVWYIYEDSKGYIWIATNNHGVIRLNPENYIAKQYFNKSTNDGPDNKAIMCLYEDKKGNFWFGTGGAGLIKLNVSTGTTKIYNENRGLSNNTIYGILEDGYGNLWLSTNKGLSKFNPETELFKVFSKKNGLLMDAFNIGAFHKGFGGEMFFGGSTGLISFFPDEIRDDSTFFPINITDFKIFNVSIKDKSVSKLSSASDFLLSNQKGLINLSYNQNMFSIEFATADYKAPKNVVYAYKMEGFDDDWRYTDADNRHATYTNLAAGHYQFKVKSTNHDGIWLNNAVTLPVYIKPPFWNTFWFRGLFLIFTILLLVCLYKWRLRRVEQQKKVLAAEVKERTYEVTLQKDNILQKKLQLESQQQEIVNQSLRIHEHDQMKLRFLTNISHEFRTPLTLILAPLENLLSKNHDEGVFQHLSLIQRNALRLLRLINQLLDTSKMESANLTLLPVKDDILMFIQQVAFSFCPLADRKNIKFDVEFKIHKSEVYFDKDKIEKIIYNLLSNAFKFTPNDGCIGLTIKLSEKDNGELQLEITCKDTGIGIPKEAHDKIFDRFFQLDNNLVTKSQGTGIGLALVKLLVELHHGEIILESHPQEGASFTVILQLPQKIESEAENDIQSDVSLLGYVPFERVLTKKTKNEAIALECYSHNSPGRR